MKDQRESGFSLVEASITLVFVVLLVIAVQTALMFSIKTRQSAESDAFRQELAWVYLQRLRALPFGPDGTPTSGELTELFDEDSDLGTITFQEVSVPAGSAGRTFTANSGSDLVRWRVVVSNDLDQDGTTSGNREGRSDLYLIEIWADDVLMFRTMRSADLAATTKDP